MDSVEKTNLALAILGAFLSDGATTAELEILAKRKNLYVHIYDWYWFVGLLPKKPNLYPLHTNILSVIRNEMIIKGCKELEGLAKKCADLESENAKLRTRLYCARTIEEVFNLKEYKEFGQAHIATRIRNRLTKADIYTIGALVVKNESDMRAIGLGRKTINEVRLILAGMGLHLGMNFEE